MDFFRSQEREIIFKLIDDVDGWEPSISRIIKVRGIASSAGNALDPRAESVVQSGAIRVFLGKAFRREAALVTVGSTVEVDGVSYAVTKCDARGVLPGRYPIRFEGVKK